MSESDESRAGIARHRAAIDALDHEILERLNARAAHAQAIGAIKGHGVAYRPEREAQVLARLQSTNRGPLSNEAVAGVFRQVMSACLALEKTLRISYLGPAGTFSHDAVAPSLRDSSSKPSPARPSTMSSGQPRAGRRITPSSPSRTPRKARSAARSISCARRRSRSVARFACASVRTCYRA
jgi:chorismate mutase-like protein